MCVCLSACIYVKCHTHIDEPDIIYPGVFESVTIEKGEITFSTFWSAFIVSVPKYERNVS